MYFTMIAGYFSNLGSHRNPYKLDFLFSVEPSQQQKKTASPKETNRAIFWSRGEVAVEGDKNDSIRIYDDRGPVLSY